MKTLAVPGGCKQGSGDADLGAVEVQLYRFLRFLRILFRIDLVTSKINAKMVHTAAAMKIHSIGQHLPSECVAHEHRQKRDCTKSILILILKF